MVKNTGDGFMLAFYSARKAVTCSVEIQKELQEFNDHNPDRQLKVRIGINVGETIKEEEDYFGMAVVMAARIMDAASGGHILVSDLLRKIAHGPYSPALISTSPEYEYSDFGWQTLKGFEEDEHLFKVNWRATRH